MLNGFVAVMRSPLAVTLTVTLAALSSASGAILANPDTFELLILHNNDMHARFEQTDKLSGPCDPGERCYGGFARVAHVVREGHRNASNGGPAFLYLNAGDTYQGTPWYSLYKWNITYMLLNAIAPDAISLGNHEFDDGVAGLTPFLENVKFPVLACNLDLSKERDLQRQKSLMKSTVFTKNNVLIGVIGYLTPDTKSLSAATLVEYIDEVQAIDAEAKRLRAQGVNILIALGHSGYDMDCKIAAEVPDIDVVIGGHSNTFLWNGAQPDGEKPEGPYPRVITQQGSSKRVPVVQAYAFTKYLGRLHLVFNGKGDLTSFDGQPLLLDDTVPQDQDILELVDVYRPGVKQLKEDVVANTAVLLDGNCRLQECNLGNLITDSMVRAHTLAYPGGKFWSDASIALISGGGVRTSIDSKTVGGNITMEQLMTVLPFGNDLMVASYKGKTLMAAFEHSVNRYDGERGYGEFLQVSGARVVYDPKAEPGSRVLKVDVLCTQCEVPAYEPLKTDDTYKVILNSFLFTGGDGYDMLKKDASSSKSLGIGDLQAAQDYLKQQSPVRQGLEGRISFMEKQISSGTTRVANVFMIASVTAALRMLL